MKSPLTLLLAFALIISLASFKRNVKNDGSPKLLFITQKTVDKVTKDLIAKYGETAKTRIERGVLQTASLWNKTDGADKDFEAFCMENFVAKPASVDSLFDKLAVNFEVLYGNFNKIQLDLKRGIHLDNGPVQPVDTYFGGFEPSAHLTDDLFQNKIAFLVILNFPFYSLKEKNELGQSWTPRQWGYARMGDLFTSREPAELVQKFATGLTNADSYISDYNIYMGNLTDKTGKSFFPSDMKLISHWGLRDELKSHYADKEGGLEKQQMIYAVMKHIIDQSIPKDVINNKTLKWNPTDNKVFNGSQAVEAKAEPDTRYQYLLDNFKNAKALDPYNPSYPTFIQRSFDRGMELSQQDVEKLFTDLCASPQVKEVANLIKTRLGRPLQPFDIWYNGFKAAGSVNEEDLNKITRERYPNTAAFKADMVNILTKLGFTPEKAAFIASKVEVDAARGSGHAAGTAMKTDVSHLRTRIAEKGMNYKGYNIAVHEFGHNVEQTITMHDVDNYMISGVPTTAFTEAVAFLFQKRDLELLGMPNTDPNKEHLMALDNFWMSYEIMGVSLLDMKVWAWMYAHPNATAAQLKEAVITTAKEVWNQYYAPVFGTKDEPILAIYSHMIDNPLYLSSYPVGHLIDFQVEQQIAKAAASGNKNAFAEEILRMYKNGRLTPQVWMQKAVGSSISIQPLLKATEEALKAVK